MGSVVVLEVKSDSTVVVSATCSVVVGALLAMTKESDEIVVSCRPASDAVVVS